MNPVRNIGTCIALAAGLVCIVLCTILGNFPIVRFMWIGFLSLIIYLCMGAHKDFSVYLKLFCSFLCGLIWGQISNLVYIYIFPTSPLWASIVDLFVIIVALVWFHFVVLGKTPFGFVPTVFLGFALTVGFWGRPFPLEGYGLLGGLPTLTGLGILVFYFLFGLVFAFLIEVVADWLAKGILPKDTSVPIDQQNN